MTVGEHDPRKEFVRKDGFLLYTDLNYQILNAAADHEVTLYDPQECTEPMCELGTEQPSAAGLLQATWAITTNLPYIRERSLFRKEAMQTELGVSSFDIEGSERANVFDQGLSDLNFPWFFAAGIAHESANLFRRDERFSKADYDSLTLGDWANMIRSEWFSKLMHRMAFTGNGVYRDFGKYPSNYVVVDSDNLSNYLRVGIKTSIRTAHDVERVQEPLALTESVETDGYTYLAAQLTPGVQNALRDQMKDSGISVGCPVARKAVRLAVGEYARSPRAKRLVGEGVLALSRQDDDTIVLFQRQTAIDRTLLAFAQQLDIYNEKYGTPNEFYKNPVDYHKPIAKHSQVPDTEAIRWPTAA